MKLSESFYLEPDVEEIARRLLGKLLCTSFNGQFTSGIIVETEAYAGVTDMASHAYNGRRTKRTEIMYRNGGCAYVYLIYGIHSLFNIVTNRENIPHAVLVRAIEPVTGIDFMLKRRNLKHIKHNLCGGPGLLTQALGINTQHTGHSLIEDGKIWIENSNQDYPDDDIICSPRVGVAYAKEDALLPRRYRIKNNKWTSLAK